MILYFDTWSKIRSLRVLEKIQEILFKLGNLDDRRRIETLCKIVKFIANNKIYNEGVQSDLKLSKPRIQSSL